MTMQREQSNDICADCSAKQPSWASVNRGVLLCDECSAIHRQLGRHISQIKHLCHSRWRPTQLSMVKYLSSACANRYWEHILYESMLPCNKSSFSDSAAAASVVKRNKKPNPSDPMHPNKADFIREKYLFQGFFKRPRYASNCDDLNRQLHASVRTGVLETSLYLLALDADPNFIHPEKGNSPLHIATQYGQLGQIELLLAYGADFTLRDASGQTALDIALNQSLSATEADSGSVRSDLTIHQRLDRAWSPLIDTLVAIYYELSDQMAYFVARRLPNHRLAATGCHVASNGCQVALGNGGHFLIAKSDDSNGCCLNGTRDRLTQLPGLAFQELCVDVCDEIDRRLTNSFLDNCLSVSSTAADPLVPAKQPSINGVNRSFLLFFLPPNTSYSSVRNQSRQKLGRLTSGEFRHLIIDLLDQTARRLLPLFPPPPPPPSNAVLITSSNGDERPASIGDVSSTSAAITAHALPVATTTTTTTTHIDKDNDNDRVSSTSSAVESEQDGVVGNGTNNRTEPVVKPDVSIVNGMSKDDVDDDKSIRSRVSKHGRGDDPVYDQVALDAELAALLSSSNAAKSTEPARSTDSSLRHQSPGSVVGRNEAVINPIATLDDQPRLVHLPHVSTGRHSHSLLLHSPTSDESLLIHNNEDKKLSESDTSKPTTTELVNDDQEAAKALEVEARCRQLTSENAELKQQLSGLEQSKQAVDNRLASLERHVKEIDSVVRLLQAEKSALLAVFSTGASMHSPQPPLTCQSPVNNTTASLSMALDDDECLVDTTNLHSTSSVADKPVNQIDNRPQDASLSSPLTIAGLDLDCSSYSPAPASPYVNVVPPGLGDEAACSDADSSPLIAMPALAATNPSASPPVASTRSHPPPIAPKPILVAPLAAAGGSSSTLRTGGGGRITDQQRRDLQAQHAQLLASIAALPDYANLQPTRSSGSPKQSITRPSQPARTAASCDDGTPPKYQTVVKTVEGAIVHIRNLIDFANENRIDDCIECIGSIQAMIDDILALFRQYKTDQQYYPSRIAQTLNDLAMIGQKLDSYRQQLMIRRLPGSQTNDSCCDQAMQLARQLIKVTKELLAACPKN